MRVNARLDDDRAAKLRHLVEVTQQTRSDVIKEALDLYYAKVQAGAASPSQVLHACGFVGSGEGPADLSARYTAYASEGLARKHDDPRG